jgi:environmental stress-induced protein Ves
MPWKNGGGSTLELAVEPPGANLETGFLWRLSSAEVAESGPFSSFPGLERWLFLLEGDGFLVDFGSRGRMDLREPYRPVRFLGDWPATATLAGGPSTDLNLMVDPNRIRASVEVLRLDRNRVFPLTSPTTLFFLAAGSASVPSLDLHLGWHHLLRLEEGAGSTLELAPGLVPAQVVKMDLLPI